MSLTLTPEMLAAAYELLRTTQPYSRWKLPAAKKLKFKVTHKAHEFGHFQFTGPKVAWIACSDRKHGQLNPLVATMAHEMIHLHMHAKYRAKGQRSAPAHGAEFWRYADRVCRIHGFDRKTF